MGNKELIIKWLVHSPTHSEVQCKNSSLKSPQTINEKSLEQNTLAKLKTSTERQKTAGTLTQDETDGENHFCSLTHCNLLVSELTGTIFGALPLASSHGHHVLLTMYCKWGRQMAHASPSSCSSHTTTGFHAISMLHPAK